MASLVRLYCTLGLAVLVYLLAVHYNMPQSTDKYGFMYLIMYHAYLCIVHVAVDPLSA